MIITLIGPDGTGKSSVRRIVASMLRRKYLELEVKEYERRFRLLPTLSALAGRKSVAKDPGRIVEHDIRHQHPLRSMLIVTYYTMEYLAYKIIFALNFASERHKVHLFARYWHDYYFGFEYARLPAGFLRLLEPLVPRPDLILFIDRSPEVIRKDKPELPLAEIRRQQNAIKASIFAKRSQFRGVHATGDLGSTAQLVFLEVCKCIENRSKSVTAPLERGELPGVRPNQRKML
jgi:thymidylate kinase